MYGGWSIADGKYGGIYGIALDGHIIYGPYNADGELWSCDDVDACNGFRHGDGSYAYASTTFWPYLVGCWGPGPKTRSHVPACAPNACGDHGAALSASLLVLLASVLLNF